MFKHDEERKKDKMENQNPEEEARVEQMIDELMRKAKIASQEYMKLDQETVDNITKAMSMAGLEHHMELAKMAVEETGRGIYEDKITKNMFATEYVYHSIKHEKTVGIIKENDEDGYVEIAEPVGIIAGVTPVTNPTSTTMFKSIIAEKNESRETVPRTGVEANTAVKDAGKAERKTVEQKKAMARKEKKPSIHERLEINKRIIQEKQGKDKPARGADLSVRTV